MKRVVAALLAAGVLSLCAQNASHRSLMHASRSSPTDLEVGGSLPGAAAAAVQFVAYTDLLRLPQVQFVSAHDENFAVPAHLAGVSLEQLRQSLAATNDAKGIATNDAIEHPTGDMILAIGEDGYVSNYPASYLAAHHPVLVLTVDGKPARDWPKTAEGEELGPYVIANPDFRPAFQVLSHSDEAQIPFEVVRLDFRSEAEVLGAITPRGHFPADSPVIRGFRIAEQNCFRCHNSGAEGGHLAGIAWPVLAAVAKSKPAFFAAYVRNPQSVYAQSKMQANPGYDDQTLAALASYFTTFAGGERE